MNRHGMLGTVLLLGCGGLLAACAESPQSSAPAYTVAPAQNIPPTAPPSPAPLSAGGPKNTRYIVVKPGQSLGGIAGAYHVSKEAIIAANHLAAPYDLKIGARIAIPLAARQAATPRVSKEKIALSAPAPVKPGPAARRVAATSRHPKVRRATPEVIPLDDPAPVQADSFAPSPPADPTLSVTTSAPRALRPPPEPGAAGRLN
jgi:LysM repeat protein